jgi:hypothetical protein
VWVVTSADLSWRIELTAREWIPAAKITVHAPGISQACDERTIFFDSKKIN